MSFPGILSAPRGPPDSKNGTASFTAAPGAGSSVQLYKQHCADEGCRPNSAFIRFLLDRGDCCAITLLSLRDNYIGPRGLRAVVRLVADCQTLVKVDFAGNGATNATVDDLCDVAVDHMSLTAILLGDNPITVVGGKRLLELLAANPRITEVAVDGTDILDTMRDRIAIAAELNRLRTEQGRPQLLAAAVHNDAPPKLPQEGSQNPVRAATLKARQRPATLEPLKATDSLHGVPVKSVADSTASSTEGEAAAKEAAAPRPVAAEVATAPPTTRLPSVQLNALRESYANRVRLFTEVSHTAASQAAAEARAELIALETASSQTLVVPVAARKPAPGNRADRVPSPVTHCGEERVGPDSDAREASDPHTAPQRSAPTPPPSAGDDTEDGSSVPPSPTAPDRFARRSIGDAEEADEGSAAAPPAAAAEPSSAPRAADGRGTGRTTNSLIGSEERFQQLFDEGCNEYSRQDLDAAYIAWSEALHVATEKNKREWIAVVSSNLQRLSYELLVKEGVTHLGLNELPAATQSFTFALDLALQARNAAWESAMHKALKQVQIAAFHSSHEAAMQLFTEAVQAARRSRAPRQPGTEDEAASADAETPSRQYVVPGTNRVMEHTEAFIGEWRSMLLVRDAVSTWCDSVRAVKKLDGGDAATLRQTIDESLNAVAAFLVQTHFDALIHAERLGWQGTGRYEYVECVLLSELWQEMLAYSDQTLKHPLLSTIIASQLGNLYLSTNQLPLAEQQFRQVVLTSGQVLMDPVLEATGAMFSAALSWQRGTYAEAEAQVLFALERCDAEASAAAPSASPGREDSCASVPPLSSRRPTGGSQQQKLPRSALPYGYVQFLKMACSLLLVSTLVHTYRHREALERLEHANTSLHCDTLAKKLDMAFSAGEVPSLDHISAISAQVKSTFVYYMADRRFEWNDADNVFVAEERLLMWVVPQSSEMRFVEVSVTKDFHTSIVKLLLQLRAGLHIDADPLKPALGTDTTVDEVDGGMITTLHRLAWMQPLQTLYAIFMDPIVDFIQVMSPLHGSSPVVTIVPNGFLWGIPFHALMPAHSESFLVETMAIQLSFGAAQTAFAALSAQRALQRDLYRDVVVVPAADVDAAVAAPLSLAFPLDAFRGREEGREVLQVLETGKVAQARERASTDSNAALMARSELLVEDLESVEAVLPKARSVHFATTATTTRMRLWRTAADGDDEPGGMCLPVTHGAMSLLTAAQVGHMELFAELVVMSNTNMSLHDVAQYTNQDQLTMLVRGFFSAGVPCVLAGLWCTPDMKPSVLFTKFYEILQGSAWQRVVAQRRSARAPGAAYGVAANAGAASDDEDGRHKAVALARAIRALFQEDPAVRYSPRVWAGYYCIGCDLS